MGKEYLRTLHGMISCLQIAIGLAATFACSFIWSNSNVFFQFYWGAYPAQIYVFIALFLTMIVVLGLLLLEVMGREVLESLGKVKLIILHVICLIMMIIAGIIDSYYLKSHTWADSYYRRLITVTVFEWILVVTYIGQIVYVIFQ